MTMLKDMLAAEQLKAYGTSEGASKAWDTRGRGQGKGKGNGGTGSKKIDKMHEVLRSHGYKMTQASPEETRWERKVDIPRGSLHSIGVTKDGWEHSYGSPRQYAGVSRRVYETVAVGSNHKDLGSHLKSYDRYL